jgi:hypothetical protein
VRKVQSKCERETELFGEGDETEGALPATTQGSALDAKPFGAGPENCS